MDEPFTCTCQMKTDLENSADVFSFFRENYPLPGIVDNLNKLSNKELRCACCLMGAALLSISRKKTETTKAIRKLSKYKEGVSVETPIFVPSGIGMFYKIIYVNL